MAFNGLKNCYDKFINWFFKTYSEDGGSMLIHLGAMGWLLSSISQVVALAMNKEITPEDKKFLYPQEIGDGIVNFTMFYGLTQVVQNVYTFLVEHGKIITKDTKEALNKIAETKNKDIKSLLAENKISTLLKDNDLDALKKFKAFKGGGDIFTTVIASVVAINIITPIIRNYIGSLFQSISIKKDNTLKQHLTDSKSKLDINPYTNTSFGKNINYNTPVLNKPNQKKYEQNPFNQPYNSSFNLWK